MASIPNGFPISLRSWPTKSADATDLPTLFQRIQTERGGFLDISEESLREEIAKEESGQLVEVESESEEDRNAEDLKARAAARQELLQQITTAHHSALNSLNFVSLLLSKANPAAVSQTISPELRDLIPLGTLGATKANNAWITPERKEDNRVVAKGWKSRDVNKSIDSILASATRLENEIQRETTYWEEILSLHDKGWSVSKVPQRKGVMGVRLGSSEASTVLRPQGLAILSRSDTGSLKLIPNPTTSTPQVVRVRIQVDDKITGTSSVPSALPESAGIAPHLVQTRNTLFALEMWHELNRELRTLGAFNIQSRDDTIIFPLSSAKTAILDLHPLPFIQDASAQSSPDDRHAQALFLSLQLLLSYSHRQSLRRRSSPPKPKPNPKRASTSQGPVQNKQPVFTESPALLRPLLTLLNHQNSLTRLHELCSFLTRTISKTSLTPLPEYTITPVQAQPPASFSKAERSIALLTNHLMANVSFKILPDTEIRLFVQTRQSNLPTSVFSVQVWPDTAELAVRCPSPGTCVEVGQVEEYVLFATAAAMALRFSSTYENPERSEEGAEQKSEDDEAEKKKKHENGLQNGTWHLTHHPPTLKLSSFSSPSPSTFSSNTDPISPSTRAAAAASDGKLLHFSLHKILSSRGRKRGLKLSVTYTFSTPPSQDIDPRALMDAGVLDKIVSQRMQGLKEKKKEKKDGDDHGGSDKDEEVEDSKEGKEDEKRGERGGKVREGEGAYEWVVWDEQGNEDQEGGDEEVKEVVKSLEDVVLEATR